MNTWSVLLVPESRFNGRYRRWVGEAQDWDSALELAEEANPGWEATQAYVPRFE